MKHFLLALLITLFPSCATHRAIAVAPATQLTATQHVLPSLIRLTAETEEKTYVCTGFSVAPRIYLTAEHCTRPIREEGAILYANRHRAFVAMTDPTVDLALIITDIDLPALTIRTKPLVADPINGYEVVQAAGYGYGFAYPLVTTNITMLLNYVMNIFTYKGTIFMHGFIGGMSGGPIYDINGDVVGVAQRSTEAIGYGVDSETILKFLAAK